MDDITKFLIETSPEVHNQILHSIDFASMTVANSYPDPESDLGRKVYYKTKKDVVEHKRKEAWEALIDKDVQKFVAENALNLWEHYNGMAEYLIRYIEISEQEAF